MRWSRSLNRLPPKTAPRLLLPGAFPAGTTITTENWQQYRDFMSEGQQALFTGKYFWKMPPSAQIDVGPTVVNALPKTYMEATEKYAGQVRLTQLPDGGLTMENYQGGIPFPTPSEPHKGWKILADVWFRYIPHLVVLKNAGGCALDQQGNVNCSSGELNYRQLSYNTDPGVPSTIPETQGKYWTQWFMITEPEQVRYTASLTISYTDLTRPEDVYAFLPSLRRYQPVSTLARCSQMQGMDITP